MMKNTEWSDLGRYFENIPSGFIKELLSNATYPWSPLERLKSHIENFFTDKNAAGDIAASPNILLDSDGNLREGSYFINKTQILADDFIESDLKIFIGAGTLIEAGSTIKNHTIIEQNCEIRQGAYIRGNVFVGERSVVGHATEMKQTVFIRHVEAGHFAYIGDSVIGSYVNLGAGTKISNLEFRSLEAKKRDQFPEISLRIDKTQIKTGVSKFGAIIGDGCETGCNSVLSPCVFLEPECWVLPNHCVAKGTYKRRSMLRQKQVRGK